MIETFGQIGAGIITSFSPLVLLVGTCWLAAKSVGWLHWTGPRQWIAFTIAAVAWGTLFVLLFARPLHILESYTCRHADDYEACMEHDDGR